MNLKAMLNIFTIILLITFLFVVDLWLHPVSGMGMGSTGYTPWVKIVNFMNYPNVYASAIVVSVVILIGMSIILRRLYTSQLKRVLYIAIPLLIALFIQFLLVIETDTFFYHRNFIGLFREFFAKLPMFFTVYLVTGFIFFILMMITCYPIGILIDKALRHITTKTPKHQV